MPNQYSHLPPFCDYLERYQAAYKPQWSLLQLRTQRVGLRRFDEWIKATGYPLHSINWQRLLEFHRFLTSQGISAGGCKRAVLTAKHALRWGIERCELLPLKLTDIYTYRLARHRWDQELPALSLIYLNGFEATRPGSFRSHRNTHRVFHTFLAEKKLTYRRMRSEHMAAFVKYTAQKDFVLHTRATMCWHIRAYLRWLHRSRKIDRFGSS